MIVFFRHLLKMLKDIPKLCTCFLIISGIGLYQAFDIGREISSAKHPGRFTPTPLV